MLTSNISHLSATLEVRKIEEPIVKAISLVVTHKQHIRETAVHFKFAKSTLHDATKAIREERDICKNGRPPVFNEEEVEDLVVEILEKDMANNPFTRKQFIEFVRDPIDI